MTPLREFFTTGISDNWNRGKSQRRKLGAVDAGIKEESAINWLKAPNKALGGITPVQALSSRFGAEEVMDMLGRIV